MLQQGTLRSWGEHRRRCRPVSIVLVWAGPLLGVVLALGQVSAAEPKGQPNIVLIVADDLGWKDLGCYGSQFYETPHIDTLASSGMRFRSAYSCGPNCAPTRACLMTGRYTPRHGVLTVGTSARGRARYRKLVPVENKTTLAPSFVTIAELLHGAGYATAHFGKWHLGAPGAAGPREQGFDLNVGGNHSGSPRGGYFSPFKNPQLPTVPEGTHLTDLLAREVCRFIRQQGERPFFAYVLFYAVHSPWQGKSELIEKYRSKRGSGGQSNPTYAAMIETLDDAVGRILQTLDELHLRDETVVLFYSDNGGVGGYRELGLRARGVTSQAPLKGGKGMLYEGGIRVPLIVRWPGVVDAGRVSDEPVTSVDFFPTLAELAGVTSDLPKPLDGVSLVPLWEGAEITRDAIYWHFPCYLQAGGGGGGQWRTTPAGAMRRGRWKLIEFFESGRLELYDLSADIGERNNLAAERPELVRDLHKELKAWRSAVSARMPSRP